MPKFTTFDGTTLHYKTTGFDNDGDVLVFLNGMTQSTAHWNSQAKAFAEAGYRVLTYDARGQGDSELGDAELTLDQHAHDLDALLDELEVDRAHLAGFSHGARIALGVANYHADRLGKLVLCSATARPTALARTIVRAWHGVLTNGGLTAMSWSALPTILGNNFLEKNENILKGIVRASVQRNSEEGVRALLEAMMDYPDLSDLAKNVSTPTLVVSADKDLLVTPEGARELAELAGGEHALVTGVGHTIPIEAPEEFRRLVREFLER
ncbi:alpha/beta fold hydrolase [Persicimonas caeni]|uniref:Alpha/beta fold hydrolase n=1 Tax=Persicimonas caeni TaxID=2292766 RepID=A0A4Y6Q0L1_PERCE|nr:alpha/beta hydrolase [Persicimonas caeni]QDG53979.1 alpha/beta fold hydrolase [Persicimonas caeni]QED35200.1 alpha/beta fold hydrolase [Persicimonas caeni]